MERSVVLQNKEQCIYLIKDTNLDFYLVIPNSKKVSIVLGLFPDMNDTDVKTLPKDADKVVVIPVINSQILTNANHLDTVSFKYLDNVLSYLINAVYKILIHNRLEVNKKILLNNHSLYSNFNDKYIEKYQGRVELYNLIPKQNSAPVMSDADLFEPVSATTVIPTFKPSEPMFKNNDSSDNNDSVNGLTDVISMVPDDISGVNDSNNNTNGDPGFISYILLGVLAAVVLLVILYMVL